MSIVCNSRRGTLIYGPRTGRSTSSTPEMLARDVEPAGWHTNNVGELLMKTRDDSVKKQKHAVNACDAKTNAKAGGSDKLGDLRAASDSAWAIPTAVSGLAWRSLSNSVGRAVSGLSRLAGSGDG